MSNERPLDRDTLETLLVEARENYSRAKQRFDEDDNHEDMQDRDMWAEVVSWLEGKMS